MAKEIIQIKIGVLGAGAIGGLLTALLQKNGKKVQCFCSNNALNVIDKHGIRVESKIYGNLIEHPNLTHSTLMPIDLLFITVKSPSLNSALIRILKYINKDTVIVSLLNGIGHGDVIRQLSSSKVIVGTIGAVEVYLNTHGVVIHNSLMTPHINLSPNSDISNNKFNLIISLLESAGFSVSIGKNENDVVWKKLVRLASIAALTAYTDSTIEGVIKNEDSYSMLESLVNELCSIANKFNVGITPLEVTNQIKRLPPTLTTSMQRDIASGKPSEIESILGGPIKAGEMFGMDIPNLKHCYAHLKLKSSNYKII